MVVQYPHSVTITPQADPVQTGGNFAAPVSGTPFTTNCRLEPASKGPVITGPDGNVVNVTFVLYMPPVTNQFRYGDLVTVTLSNGSQQNGFLKQQSNGQLNTRIWV